MKRGVEGSGRGEDLHPVPTMLYPAAAGPATGMRLHLGIPMDESLCRRCGKCCYKKLDEDDSVRITPFPCEFLDVHTNLCTIYSHRFTTDPDCLSVEEGLRISAFPADCGYVRACAPPGYRPARDDWYWGKRWRDFDEIADLLDVSPRVRAWVRARGPEAAPGYLDRRSEGRRPDA